MEVMLKWVFYGAMAVVLMNIDRIADVVIRLARRG